MIEALIALSIVLSIAVIALLLYFRSRMAAMGKDGVNFLLNRESPECRSLCLF